MTYQINKAETLHIKPYHKKPGGWPRGPWPEPFKSEEEWAGAMKKKYGNSVPIDGHTRRSPEPTPRELKQKKMNNGLAARGSNKRVWISPTGKAKIMSKDKAKHLLRIERVKGRR